MRLLKFFLGNVAIERDNSNTRHHLGRMTRHTKVVSKKEFMVNVSIKLWVALADSITFLEHQRKYIGIFT
jgi:insertion element IS1 protein InsB